MPSRVWLLWAATALIVAGFPIVNFLYWPAVQRAHRLPSDGDTVIIPIFGSLVIALLAAPLVLTAAWLCLRRYNPATRLTAWRPDRLGRSVLATLMFGGVAAALAAAIIADSLAGLSWPDQLWSGYSAFLSWWLLALRAAAIEQLK